MSLHRYPLSWPAGWKRTPSSQRQYARFGKSVIKSGSTWNSKKSVTVAESTTRVHEELRRMGIREDDMVISTNLALRLDGLPRSGERKPDDPGAAVYWRKGAAAQMKCIAIDRYTTVEGNLAAIAATLEAMRAIERHGGAEILERSFQGFTALPQQASSTWRATLGFSADETVTVQIVDKRVRELAMVHHPDAGGDVTRFAEITAARTAARLELGAA